MDEDETPRSKWKSFLDHESYFVKRKALGSYLKALSVQFKENRRRIPKGESREVEASAELLLSGVQQRRAAQADRRD